MRFVGLSEVSVEEITAAQQTLPVVSVQNLYNLGNRRSEGVLEHCEREGLAFLPWFPIAAGALTRPGGPLEQMSRATGASTAQLALAWLLRRSPVVLPIPGTSSLEHLEDNCAAASVQLGEEDYAALGAAA